NIRVGDEVATKKGNVLIEFADSSTIRLEENSNLVFNKLSHFGKTGMVDTRLRLKRGSLSTEVTPLVKGSRYEITTPSAVAAVRGTEFRLSTQGNETQLEVIEGEVSFAGEHGTTQVFAGNGARIKKGSAIIEQTKLADAPKALFAERVVDDLPSTLSWEEQKSAEAYRVQLTDNKQNGKLVKQGKIQKPELELEHIENGEYDVSMRAIDANGFEGVDSVTRIAVDIGTEQAKLIAPLAKSILDSTKPTFSWNFVKPDTLGKLQISKDKGFNLLISQTDFDAAQQIAPRKALMPGSYYWRVVSLADDGETANSEVRNFSVRGILKPVKILSVNYIDSQVGLFWNKVDNTQAYILQVSDSKSFENILKE
ncbi:FecR domain-containing protein, partial [Oleiphilus sp. HI0128]